MLRCEAAGEDVAAVVPRLGHMFTEDGRGLLSCHLQWGEKKVNVCKFELNYWRGGYSHSSLGWFTLANANLHAAAVLTSPGLAKYTKDRAFTTQEQSNK